MMMDGCTHGFLHVQARRSLCSLSSRVSSSLLKELSSRRRKYANLTASPIKDQAAPSPPFRSSAESSSVHSPRMRRPWTEPTVHVPGDPNTTSSISCRRCSRMVACMDLSSGLCLDATRIMAVKRNGSVCIVCKTLSACSVCFGAIG